MKRFFSKISHLRMFQQVAPSQSVKSHQPHHKSSPKEFSSTDEESFKYYASLRMYKHKSWYDLVNTMCMTTLCSSDFFVNNCYQIYNVTRKVFGSTITDFTIANTFGRIFSAGDSLRDMGKFIDDWQFENIGIVTNYSNELSQDEDAPAEEMDESARIFIETINIAAKRNPPQNGVAIKCSCLCPPSVMKKANNVQLSLRAIFSEGYGNLSSTLTAKQIFERIEKYNISFNLQDFQDFMLLYLDKHVTQQNLEEVQITKLEWLQSIHMFYPRDNLKNKNKILKQLTNFSEEEQIELEKYSIRLDAIFKTGIDKKCPVYVDAEQSYYQEAIDSLAFQYSAIYNPEMTIVINTYQNYLKISKEKIDFIVEASKASKVPFGAKMVRGAYMVEERDLAKESSHEDPILPTAEATTENYHRNIEHMIANWVNGSFIMIASHNEKSIDLGKQLLEKYDTDPSRGTFEFGQLLGLGDHITFSLADQGYTVGKYVAFGPSPILIPFFVRRAQESKQMFSSTKLQRRLVLDEMKQRTSPRKEE